MFICIFYYIYLHSHQAIYTLVFHLETKLLTKRDKVIWWWMTFLSILMCFEYNIDVFCEILPIFVIIHYDVSLYKLFTFASFILWIQFSPRLYESLNNFIANWSWKATQHNSMAEVLRNKSIGKKVIIGIDGSDNAISAIECKFSFFI